MSKLEDIYQKIQYLSATSIMDAMKEYAEYCCKEQKLISIHTFNPYMSIDDVKNLIDRTPIYTENNE